MPALLVPCIEETLVTNMRSSLRERSPGGCEGCHQQVLSDAVGKYVNRTSHPLPRILEYILPDEHSESEKSNAHTISFAHLLEISQSSELPRTMVSQSAAARSVSSRDIGRSCIKRISINGFRNPNYLPKGAFHDFLDEGLVSRTIEKELRSQSYDARELRELVTYSIRNPRLFLTLAATDLISKMPLLYKGGFPDSALPVVSVEDDENNLTLYSVADGERKRPWKCFVEGDDGTNNWKHAQLEQFISKQWTFLAALFGHNNSLEYKIHHKRPLPYVQLSNEASGGGHFGRVFKFGLRQEHVSLIPDEYHYLRKVRKSNLRTPRPRDRSSCSNYRFNTIRRRYLKSLSRNLRTWWMVPRRKNFANSSRRR